MHLLSTVFSLFIFVYLSGILNCYDIWNDVPCFKQFTPEECKPENVELLTVDDYDKCGPAALEKNARNYFLGASGRRLTYKDNKDAFSRIKIVPKVLRDVSRNQINSSTLGIEVDFPIGASPVALQRLAHPDGELATVKGLSNFKTIMILSNFASTLIEDVGKAAEGTLLQLWMQVYLYKDRRVTLDIVRRAERSGFKAFVTTVDAPVHAFITCNARAKSFSLNASVVNVDASVVGNGDVSDLSLTFEDITWLKSQTKLPIIVKGILNGNDAKRAILAGASAIMVSNHGGRQMDGTLATIDALPKVVAAVNKLYPRRQVFLDGGVRSGTDVYKALARGARMVFVGRPTIWGLALGGSEGVRKMMTLLRNDFNQTMLIAGASKPSEIKEDTLLPALNKLLGIIDV
ncbi:hypothetical protein JTE90_002843 [Oedothorax gibbosus]|uniref:(S)-2-hydroxy-acid oxidase n=1 Tax=Oedothorax gibbosus TaxID=931172 RepID=A0AAV6UIK2_9ARAC|nr:hypothetical protein JTE90_002843 [Oedothorax gibbosus]